jgi:hypothetical protein
MVAGIMPKVIGARTDTILPYPITGNMPASNFNIL